MRHIKAIIIAALLLSLSGAAWGDCSVTSTQVGFGNYDPLNDPSAWVTGEISVTCSPGTAYTIQLDAGANSGGVFMQRIMLSSSGSALNYNIFRDATHTEIWGDGTGNTYTRAGIGTGAAQRYILYAYIPAGQKKRAGGYNDSIQVQVNW